MDDFWIMRPFNALFWAVFAAFALLLAAGCLLLRGKREKAKKAVLVRAGLNICWNTSGNVMNVS